MPKKIEVATVTAAQLKKIAETAAAAAIEAYQKEAERERKESKDKRLHNVHLLLKKYRGMIVYAQNAVYDAAQLEDDSDLQMLLCLMGAGRERYSFEVECIQKRVAETRAIIDHVKKMLDYYRYRCESSQKEDEIRRWECVYHRYISEDEEMSVEELADKYQVAPRTVYRYLDAAEEDLSSLLFGFIE